MRATEGHEGVRQRWFVYMRRAKAADPDARAMSRPVCLALKRRLPSDSEAVRLSRAPLGSTRTISFPPLGYKYIFMLLCCLLPPN